MPRERSTKVPGLIVVLVAAAVTGLSVFYLLRPQPLLVQGEVDATRLDIAARVDGRVKEVPVARGQDVASGTVLVSIDNPETIAKRDQMVAAKAVAEAQLANVLVGNSGRNHRGTESRAGARASQSGSRREDV